MEQRRQPAKFLHRVNTQQRNYVSTIVQNLSVLKYKTKKITSA